MTHHSMFFNDENSSSIQSRCFRLFHRRDNSTTTFPPFYFACEKNDLAFVELSLKKMKFNEIDHQYPPNNETVLHIATRKQYKEMVEILLHHGAQRTLKNIDGQQAYELANTQDMKDLFKRSESSRFAFPHSFENTTFSSESKLNCKSCSLVNSNTMYEWELVDRNASEKALQFRREFKVSPSTHSKIWKKKFYSLTKSYLPVHRQDLSVAKSVFIDQCFQRALREQNPNYLAKAYTSCQNFSRSLNLDMARNVIHNLTNGCSQFSCQCLYSTEDGTKSIANIFLHHPNFQQLSFQGQVYRGIPLTKDKLDHYRVGSCIITTTFLSTSKSSSVARMFSGESERKRSQHSFFCTYTIVSNGRTAIDISQLSVYPEEEEVLILPYSTFLITKIEEEPETTMIYLEEQCLTHIV